MPIGSLCRHVPCSQQTPTGRPATQGSVPALGGERGVLSTAPPGQGCVCDADSVQGYPPNPGTAPRPEAGTHLRLGVQVDAAGPVQHGHLAEERQQQVRGLVSLGAPAGLGRGGQGGWAVRSAQPRAPTHEGQGDSPRPCSLHPRGHLRATAPRP